MAIRKYTLNANERAMTGFSEVYVLKKADFVINATTNHTLCNLKQGDVIFPAFMLIDVKAAVAGPTATMSLGLSATQSRWITATSVATAKGHVTPSITAIAAASDWNTRWQPLVVAADDTLVTQAVLSNAAITAGEVWIWVRILRQAVRDQVLL